MMSDDFDKLHREKARALATELMRDPILALQYRDIVFDASDDTDSERMVTKWMTGIGYPTRHDLLRDELVNAPRTNVAAWDGAYVIRVNKGPLVLLLINASGVRVNGCWVAGATFSDGILRFEATGAASWNGELQFNRVSPTNGARLSEGGEFQRECTGKLWKKDASMPPNPNALGATMRIELPASPADAVEAVSANSHAPSALLGDPKTSSFVGKWMGDYRVQLISVDPNTGGDVTKEGPDLGIKGESDKKVTLTYIDPLDIDVSGRKTQPQPGRIVYTGEVRAFDLTFADFGGADVRGFSGRIYPSKAVPPPKATNVTGVARSPLAPDPSAGDGAIVDTGLAVTIATLVAAVGAIVATGVAVIYGNKLTAEREYQLAIKEGHEDKLDALRERLNGANIKLQDLPEQTKSNVSDVALFGDTAARQKWAKKELERLDGLTTTLVTDANTVRADLERLETDINVATKVLEEATTHLENVKSDLNSSQAEKDQAQRERNQAARDLADVMEEHENRDRDRQNYERQHAELVRDVKAIHNFR